MKNCYEIFEDGQPVGTAEVERQGLYYCFSCRCRGDRMLHIRVSRGGREELLGVPAPEGGTLCLRKKIPVSRFPEGEFCFFVGEGKREIFVPVVPGEPFAYLRQLKNARYALRDGIAGVVISDIQDESHGTMV